MGMGILSLMQESDQSYGISFCFILCLFPCPFLLHSCWFCSLLEKWKQCTLFRSWAARSSSKLEYSVWEFKQQTLLALWSGLSSITLNPLYFSHRAKEYCFIFLFICFIHILLPLSHKLCINRTCIDLWSLCSRRSRTGANPTGNTWMKTCTS